MRTILVAAAAVAMMAVGVSAANPQAVQDIFVQIATVVRVDEFRQEMTTTDGEQMTVLSLPKIQVENQEGRAVLVIDEEQTDITDALAQDGSYVYEKATQEGTKLTVTVKGSGRRGLDHGGVHVRGRRGSALLQREKRRGQPGRRRGR